MLEFFSAVGPSMLWRWKRAILPVAFGFPHSWVGISKITSTSLHTSVELVPRMGKWNLVLTFFSHNYWYWHKCAVSSCSFHMASKFFLFFSPAQFFIFCIVVPLHLSQFSSVVLSCLAHPSPTPTVSPHPIVHVPGSFISVSWLEFVKKKKKSYDQLFQALKLNFEIGSSEKSFSSFTSFALNLIIILWT